MLKSISNLGAAVNAADVTMEEAAELLLADASIDPSLAAITRRCFTGDAIREHELSKVLLEIERVKEADEATSKKDRKTALERLEEVTLKNLTKAAAMDNELESICKLDDASYDVS